MYKYMCNKKKTKHSLERFVTCYNSTNVYVMSGHSVPGRLMMFIGNFRVQMIVREIAHCKWRIISRMQSICVSAYMYIYIHVWCTVMKIANNSYIYRPDLLNKEYLFLNSEHMFIVYIIHFLGEFISKVRTSSMTVSILISVHSHAY